MINRQIWLLRTAFLTGAITDALALIPMLSPAVACLMLGFENMGGPYRFAMGYAASLMAGWTALLLWAYRKPVERAFVAVLTMIVIAGNDVFSDACLVFIVCTFSRIQTGQFGR